MRLTRRVNWALVRDVALGVIVGLVMVNALQAAWHDMVQLLQDLWP